MTAVLYDEVLCADHAHGSTPAAPLPGPSRHSPIVGGGDPLVDAAARMLSVPLRQLYAALWRVGVIEVLA
ncbi:Rv1535 family protein [Mycobacterium sp. Lab-001]|uniref:Rv1535 family protein n=1 Tax=Mycobacterium sp. Lab-001 TaxID=3410136 RepID=UPI003D17CFF8